MKIIFFAQLEEFTGSSVLEHPSFRDLDQLRSYLHNKFPELGNANYAIAVNHKIVNGNCPLHEQDEVALLPPFSGG